jgi:hypothetical protein
MDKRNTHTLSDAWAFDAGTAWDLPDIEWEAPEWNEPQPLTTWDAKEPE